MYGERSKSFDDKYLGRFLPLVAVRKIRDKSPQSNVVTGTVGKRALFTVLFLLWLGTVGVVLFAGLDYYLTPLQDRPYSDLYELYKPSGDIGHGLGIVGSAFLVLGVFSYSSRKRFGWLANAGKLSP